MRWLLALVLTFSSLPAVAESQFYGEFQLGVHGVQHSELDFYPGFASGSVGMYVRPRIGVELFYDRATSTGRDDDFDVEVNEASGIAARFESPAQIGLQAYILLGYVTYSINQYENLATPRRLAKENFTGARISLGLAKTLQRYRQVQFVFEYRNYDVDAPLRVDGFGLGLRVKLQ
ncbi:MAG: outer membrane beta-barrel protein [Granulosicoccaceae bacterium]